MKSFTLTKIINDKRKYYVKRDKYFCDNFFEIDLKSKGLEVRSIDQAEELGNPLMIE